MSRMASILFAAMRVFGALDAGAALVIGERARQVREIRQSGDWRGGLRVRIALKRTWLVRYVARRRG